MRLAIRPFDKTDQTPHHEEDVASRALCARRLFRRDGAGRTHRSGGGFSLSGNAAIVSDYRFRGYSQTDFRPAVQLGFDLTHSSGFYLGNWNSNVSDFVFTDGNLEMDFYGGWKGDVGGGFTLDAGVLHYYYPGSSSPKGGNYNNTDLYLGASYGNYSLKYSYTPSDFFSTPDSKGTWYLDGTANFDLGDGWGLVGHLATRSSRTRPIWTATPSAITSTTSSA